MLKFMIFKETKKNNYFIIIVDLILTKIWNICVFWEKNIILESEIDYKK